ncbi:MAG: peptide-binding protein [Bdellovibrionales bacterium]|nr:peptide-binding protein [Bdellovibrionales bacterium]
MWKFYRQYVQEKGLNSKIATFILLWFSFLFLMVQVSCVQRKGQKIQIKKSETFYTNLGVDPKTLHPIKSVDLVASIVQGYILESLFTRDVDTYELKPNLAERWEQSPDGKTLTFYLKKNLRWSDGKPLTAKDVKFTFDAAKNPEYEGIHLLPSLENITSVTVKDDHTVVVKSKQTYFKTFEIIAAWKIIPEHIYKDPKDPKLNKVLIGSGPYILSQYLRGKMLVLTKNENWHGKDFPVNQGLWNFKNIAFRFIKEESDELLRIQKGSIDYVRLSSEAFEQKTSRPPWGKEILKTKVKNKGGRGYGYIGFNLKKPLFQDRRVRKALAHLMDREMMRQKLQFGYGELATGPWYFWSDYADPHVKPIQYDLKKANALLKEAGWSDQDQDGVLEKKIDGKIQPFSFTVLLANPDSEKYLTLYKEDLKKAGVDLNIKMLDWTAFLKVMDDRKFDAVMLGWSAPSIDLDPKALWHSESSRKKGYNFISYSNPKVDALIDKGRKQLNRQERIKTFREVYRLIAEDVPYIFLFNKPHVMYGVNKRIQVPKPTFNYSIGVDYWKLKP